MNGFERRKQLKIEQIFNVSAQLFFKHGYQKVSVNEIAQMANVSPATVYNYFGTKEQLYADTLIHWMDKQLEQYVSILDSGLSFPEKTKKIMLLEAKNLKILTDELLKVPASDLGELAEWMEHYTDEKVKPFFIKFVTAGKQEGYIHQGLTEEVTMFYFKMFKNELGKYWEAVGEVQTLQLDQLMELFFYGLAGEKRE